MYWKRAVLARPYIMYDLWKQNQAIKNYHIFVKKKSPHENWIHNHVCINFELVNKYFGP